MKSELDVAAVDEAFAGKDEALEAVEDGCFVVKNLIAFLVLVAVEAVVLQQYWPLIVSVHNLGNDLPFVQIHNGDSFLGGCKLFEELVLSLC